ncbi:MAG: DNA primase [Chloroflexi bacterium]|nr:DNA primase [Chloroflexota bacterium]
MAVTDDIKARVDIVDVVSQYVPELKKSGRNFTARCPFHQERTPSFVVFPDRQSWRCFGACAVGGDVFSFVMKADGVAFPQAMRSLAERAGVVIPERRRADTPRNPIFDVNEAALRFFRDELTADRGALARSYAERRHLGLEAIVTFGIGYAPSSGGELLKRLGEAGFAEELLLAAGVVIRGQNGEVRDMLRGRLVFTLRNADGEVVGFAGRSLDGTDPKYINTPQTAVFDKGRMLYGFDRAKDAIAREGVAVVVEGYTDVITAHEHGYANVVASMGTALTDEQVALLRARAHRIVLALDADAAGQEAMRRRLWAVAESVTGSGAPAWARERSGDLSRWGVVTLQGGKDPDEIIRADPGSWKTLVAEPTPILDYLIEAESARGGLTAEEANAPTVQRFWRLIAELSDWAAQDRLVQRLADRLGVGRTTLEAAMGRMASRAQIGRPQAGRGRARGREAPEGAVESVLRTAGREPVEEHALALALQYPEILARVGEAQADRFVRPDNRAILSALQEAGTIEVAHAQADGPMAEHLDQLSRRVLPPADPKQRAAEWTECLRRLEERYLRDLKEQETIALTEQAPGDEEYREAVSRQALDTNERLRDLFTGETAKP